MTSHAELIERVARAIYAASGYEAERVAGPDCLVPGYDEDDEDAREFSRLLARAALEASTITALEERIRVLSEHIREQIEFVETRIQDGIEMGATVWRIALEDVVRVNRAALNQSNDDYCGIVVVDDGVSGR